MVEESSAKKAEPKGNFNFLNLDEIDAFKEQLFPAGSLFEAPKDWKERRAKFLKEKCEICDSTVTLTIQHLSHSFGASFITCAYNKRTFLTSK